MGFCYTEFLEATVYGNARLLPGQSGDWSSLATALTSSRLEAILLFQSEFAV
jgi:hypothetical protein